MSKHSNGLVKNQQTMATHGSGRTFCTCGLDVSASVTFSGGAWVAWCGRCGTIEVEAE